MANLLIAVSDATVTVESVNNIFGKADEVLFLTLPTTQVSTSMIVPNMIILTMTVE